MSRQFNHSTTRMDYTITVSSTQALTILLSQKLSLESWKGNFTSHDIDVITKKTSYPIPFREFQQMLYTALQKKDLNVFVDIMSSYDLQKIRMKKMGDKVMNKNIANKRFLILTRMFNQQKTYYPLPLHQHQQPMNIQKLREVYHNLLLAPKTNQSFSMTYKQGAKPKSVEVDQLRSQNQILKAKIKRLQKSNGLDIQDQREKAKERLKKATQFYQQQEKNLEKKQMQMIIQLQAVREDLRYRRGKLIKDDPKVHKQQQQNEKEHQKQKRQVNKNQREIQRNKNEIQKSQKRFKDQTIRVKQLQAEYDAVRKKSRGGRGFTAYSGSNKSYSVGSKKSYSSKNSSKGSWGV